MKLKDKEPKEALETVLDLLYAVVTDGDGLYDDEINEILDYCKEHDLNTDFKTFGN